MILGRESRVSFPVGSGSYSLLGQPAEVIIPGGTVIRHSFVHLAVRPTRAHRGLWQRAVTGGDEAASFPRGADVLVAETGNNSYVYW